MHNNKFSKITETSISYNQKKSLKKLLSRIFLSILLYLRSGSIHILWLKDSFINLFLINKMNLGMTLTVGQMDFIDKDS